MALRGLNINTQWFLAGMTAFILKKPGAPGNGDTETLIWQT